MTTSCSGEKKVIILRTLQCKMLEIIQQAHLGMGKCRWQARDFLYWPGMNAKIEDMMSRCQICAKFKKTTWTHKMPMGNDHFELGPWNYLILGGLIGWFLECLSAVVSCTNTVIYHDTELSHHSRRHVLRYHCTLIVISNIMILVLIVTDVSCCYLYCHIGCMFICVEDVINN